MEWGLLMAIVGLAALLQLAFFWYYLKLGKGNDSVYPKVTGESGENAAGAVSNQSRAGAESDQVVICRECGAENDWDVAFSYCSHCASKIG